MSDRFIRTIPKWKVFLANLITVLFTFHDIRRIVFCLNKRKHLVSTVIVFFFLFIVNITELITKRKQKTKIIDYMKWNCRGKTICHELMICLIIYSIEAWLNTVLFIDWKSLQIRATNLNYRLNCSRSCKKKPTNWKQSSYCDSK